MLQSKHSLGRRKGLHLRSSPSRLGTVGCPAARLASMSAAMRCRSATKQPPEQDASSGPHVDANVHQELLPCKLASQQCSAEPHGERTAPLTCVAAVHMQGKAGIALSVLMGAEHACVLRQPRKLHQGAQHGGYQAAAQAVPRRTVATQGLMPVPVHVGQRHSLCSSAPSVGTQA